MQESPDTTILDRVVFANITHSTESAVEYTQITNLMQQEMDIGLLAGPFG